MQANGYANKPLCFYSKKLPKSFKSSHKPDAPTRPVEKGGKFGLKNAYWPGKKANPYDHLSLIDLQTIWDEIDNRIEFYNGTNEHWAFERVAALRQRQELIRQAKDWMNPIVPKPD